MPSAPNDPSADRWARRAVWAVWAAMSAALLLYLWLYASNAPFNEDWELIPVLTGQRSFSAAWLWEQLIEHRYVLSKALLYVVWIASGGDFRSSMLLDALLLSGLAAAFVYGARTLRGRTSFADAFFPLALLHWGHHETLLFFAQVYFVLPVVLFSAVMLVIATDAWRGRLGVTIALGASVVLLPLNGAIGLLVAMPLAVWLLYAAAVRWRERESRREATVLFCSGLITIVVAALYFVGYESPTHMNLVPRTVAGTFATVLEVFGVAFGPAAERVWPLSGVVVALVFASAAIRLSTAVASSPSERLRATGFMACLVAVGLLVAAVGYGRTVVGPGAGFASRYALLVALGLCCAFLTALVFAERRTGQWVPAALCAGMLALLPINLQRGVDYGRFRSGPAEGLIADAREGVPPHAITERYWTWLYLNRDAMTERLELMRDARLGPYKGVPVDTRLSDGPFRAVPVQVQVVGSNDVRFEDGVARALGSDPWVVYALPSPATVAGIRVRFARASQMGAPPRMTAFWRLSAEEEFTPYRRSATVTPAPHASEQEATFWVYGTVDEVRIDPDERSFDAFRLVGVELLVID